ncbi:E3 ubiquitin-protein ligase CHIP-like isoform X2 [Tasmannia lanceolata]|uniref:E3 ubiquitin-protein ligase CHIP-like isoform X2 n=1 Tax=Tasmannia lanceolata TaxID=3420 RepID=UPI004062F31C
MLTPSNWTKVEEDCKRALKLDENSVKAHYMMGRALLQRQEYAEGVKELTKALDLGRRANPKSCMVEDILQELAKAKDLEWEHASSERLCRMQSLKEACEQALRKKYQLDSSQLEGNSDEDANTHLDEHLRSLSQVFNTYGPSEVPDYLCCKITFDIFRDPVITPSGITYERTALLHHLDKVGKFDPMTRERLGQHQLVPNLAIKEAAQAFLSNHGCAYKMQNGYDLHWYVHKWVVQPLARFCSGACTAWH